MLASCDVQKVLALELERVAGRLALVPTTEDSLQGSPEGRMQTGAEGNHAWLLHLLSNVAVGLTSDFICAAQLCAGATGTVICTSRGT